MKTNRIKFCLTTTFVVVVFLGITTIANGQEIRISNVSITDVMENLARQSRINFIIDPKLFVSPNGSRIAEPRLTFTWTNISANDALLRVLKENGLILIEDKFTTVARITGTNQTANVVDASLLGSDTNNAASLPNGLNLMVRFDYAPLDEALKNLIEHGHINVILDPKVSDYVDPADNKFHNAPTVSVRWESVTPRQAIVALCENYDLVIVKDSATGVIQIKPKD